MMLRRSARPGTVLVEAALIYPVLFLLTLGVIMVGLGVFRYQQVSHISREASRWASVRGNSYDPLYPDRIIATEANVFEHAVKPHASGMHLNNLTCKVEWNKDAQGNWDKRPLTIVNITDPVTGLPIQMPRSNTVRVTITYSWNTGLFGTIPVSSTSVNTIFY